MDNIKPDQPAFPTIRAILFDSNEMVYDVKGVEGMPLRTYLAGRAMTWYLASYPSNAVINPQTVAKNSVELADALIAELNKPVKQ